MLRNVTVGLDGSPESLAAADWAAREALLRGSQLRLVHAWQVQLPVYAPLAGTYLPPSGPESQRQWAESMLGETEAKLTRRYPGLRTVVDRLAEEPVPALLAEAREAEPLVLGSRGLSGVGGFLVGSAALAVAARTERPVVLVRAQERAQDEHRQDPTGAKSATTPYRDVVLGLDLAEPSDTLIEFAFDAATVRAATLRVVHGWSLPPYYVHGGAIGTGFTAELVEEERQRLADVLAPWREKFPGVEVSGQTVIGGAGPHLVDASYDASLVVVGRRTRRSRVGTRIGPVTHAVLHHAQAPVAVVPHD
jgi:nucleotide-binding universal stress UspA family protein